MGNVASTVGLCGRLDYNTNGQYGLYCGRLDYHNTNGQYGLYCGRLEHHNTNGQYGLYCGQLDCHSTNGQYGLYCGRLNHRKTTKHYGLYCGRLYSYNTNDTIVLLVAWLCPLWSLESWYHDGNTSMLMVTLHYRHDNHSTNGTIWSCWCPWFGSMDLLQNSHNALSDIPQCTSL